MVSTGNPMQSTVFSHTNVLVFPGNQSIPNVRVKEIKYNRSSLNKFSILVII